MGTPTRRLVIWSALAVLAVSACGGGSDDGDDEGSAVDGSATPATELAGSAPSTESGAAADSAVATTPPDAEPDSEPTPADPRCGNPNEAGGVDDVACDRPHEGEFIAEIPTPSRVDPSLDPGDDPAFHEACLDDLRAFFRGDRAGDFTTATFVVEGTTTECWTSVAEPVLVGSITVVGLERAIEPLRFVDELPTGSCFRFPGELVSFVEPTDCVESIEDDEVFQMLGTAPFALDTTASEDDNDAAAVAACDAAIAETTYDVPIAPFFFVLTPTPIGADVYDQSGATCIGERLGEELVDASGAPDATDGTRSVGDCADGVSTDYAPQPCDEPHDAQFAGVVDSPVEVLPTDPDETRAVLAGACATPVAELIDRPVESTATSVGFRTDAALGEPAREIECFFEIGDDLLLGAIDEIGLDGALGSARVISDLPPGTCFEFSATENFSFGDVADCSSPDALVVVGTFEAEGPEAWPGDDELRRQRELRCAELLAETGVAADPSSVSGTYPSRSSWEGAGRRLTTCDGTPT